MSLPVGVVAANVDQLVDMGFSQQQSILALQKHGNDMARAVDWLFSPSGQREASVHAANIATRGPSPAPAAAVRNAPSSAAAARIRSVHPVAPASFNPYGPVVDSAAAAAAAAPRVMHLWTTPLLVARPPLRDVRTFNQLLSARATDAFDALLARSGVGEATENRGDDARGANERFFQWQRDQHELGSKAEPAYLALARSDEFKTLSLMFDQYSREYLAGAGKDDEWQKQYVKPNSLFCWATVSSHGNYHLTHTHPGHMLAGVYYSRIPSGSGTIIFDDPRGPRWPFDGRYIHTPIAGDLILFPSWLVHQVTPTQGAERRVSFSCNGAGTWEDLADVNLG